MAEKNSYSFMHESNTVRSNNMLLLRINYGMAGYGLYWAIIEQLRQCGKECRYDINNVSGLAKEIDVDENYLRKFIQDCIVKFNLFNFNGSFFWSNNHKCFKRNHAFYKNTINDNRLSVNKWLYKKKKILKRDNYICQYCGSTLHLECDHLIPIIRGGTNEYSNLITACQKCNRQKHDKLPLDFILWKIKKGL